MKIMVVAPYGAHFYHFETDLELIETHLRDGDSTTVLVCNAELSACDINIDHRPDECINCVSRRRWSLKNLLSRSVRTDGLIRLNRDDRRALATLRTTFSGLDDLRSYRFQSFDLGMAVLSSVISLCREPDPPLLREATRIKRLCETSASIYLSVRRHIEEDSYTRIYAYNGRFAPMRAVLRACQEKGVDCFLHDRGSAVDRYALYKNALPHDIPEQEKRIREAWDKAEDASTRNRATEQFFEDRAVGISRNWISFVSDQDENRLPESWDPKEHNIVAFMGSEDEFASIGDQWRNPLYLNQTEGIRRVASDLRGTAGTRLYIRLHPNLRGLENQNVEDTVALDGDNIHVVSPESPVSSYALLHAADRVLTFGSSMGIEATYWNKTSVLAGPCFYRNLGSTHNPESHSELIEMLSNELPPADRLGALMFGHFNATNGIRFRYFRPENILDGTFRGKRVVPGPLMYRLLLALRSTAFSWTFPLLTKIFAFRAELKLRKISE